MRAVTRILATCSAAVLLAALWAAPSASVLAASASASQTPQKAKAQKPTAPTAARPAVQRAKAAPAKAAPSKVTKQRAAKSSKIRNVKSGNPKVAKVRYAPGISCVPFARSMTGLAVTGNAHTWWTNAAGTYERGQRPERGSVLNFRAVQRMKLGHVAVVTTIVDPRTIEIDHANWAGPGGRKGQVARGVPVIDVSARNDWSAVQVGLPGGGFGSVYPTYGFIYDRPDRGVMIANTLARPDIRYSQVADAWTARANPVSVNASFIDAPTRALQ